jgi:hypothetical protein
MSAGSSRDHPLPDGPVSREALSAAATCMERSVPGSSPFPISPDRDLIISGGLAGEAGWDLRHWPRAIPFGTCRSVDGAARNQLVFVGHRLVVLVVFPFKAPPAATAVASLEFFLLLRARLQQFLEMRSVCRRAGISDGPY